MDNIKNSIIIPTYNNYIGLKKCLESIFKNTYLKSIEIIIVCNGASKQTKQILDEYKTDVIKTIWIDEPIGFSNAINKGILNSSGENLILLNDDTILLDQEKNQWINILYQTIKNKNKDISAPHLLFQENVNFAVFFCCMIPRNIFEKVGFLDSQFKYGGVEDIDWCYRAKKLGINIKQTPVMPIYHAGEDTVKRLNNWGSKFKSNII